MSPKRGFQRGRINVFCILAMIGLATISQHSNTLLVEAQGAEIDAIVQFFTQNVLPHISNGVKTVVVNAVTNEVRDRMMRGVSQLPQLAEYVQNIVLETLKKNPDANTATTVTEVQKAFSQIFDYQQVIQFDSFREIGTRGFVVKSNINPKWFPVLDKFGNKLRRTVSLLGACDVGKTFLGSMLCGQSYDQGFNVSTHAISMMRPLRGSSSIFFDSAGLGKRSPFNQLYDRAITDAFIEETLVGVSDVVIFVVNTMRARDQATLMRILERIRGTHKQVIVVHNFRRLVTVPMAEQHIERYIKTAFNATYQPHSGGFYQSYHPEAGKYLRHLVLAEHGTDAGKKYNSASYETLHNLIDSVETTADRDVDIVKEVMEYMKKVLPNYFFPEASIASVGGLRNQSLQLEMHRDANGFTQFVWERLKKAASTVASIVPGMGSSSSSAASATPSPSDPFAIEEVDLPADIQVPGCANHKLTAQSANKDADANSTIVVPTAYSCKIIRLKDPRQLEYIPKSDVRGPPSIFPDIRTAQLMHKDGTIWRLLVEAPGLSNHSVSRKAHNLRLELVKPRPEAHTAKSANCDPNSPSSCPFAWQFEKDERRFSKMVLQFPIPSNIDPATIRKQYHNNGYLEITGNAFGFNAPNGVILAKNP